MKAGSWIILAALIFIVSAAIIWGVTHLKKPQKHLKITVPVIDPAIKEAIVMNSQAIAVLAAKPNREFSDEFSEEFA